MMKYVLGALLSLCLSVPAMADLTKKQAADLLYNSTVAVLFGGSEPGCSASKIGPGAFLTARHCIDPTMKFLTKSGQILTPRSVYAGMEKKKDGKRYEDWAIVYTSQDDTSIPVLPLGCERDIYLGMDVAYGGYPVPTRYTLAFGAVVSIGPLYSQGNNADYVMDIAASPGSSGSPVISMETGEVVGILTEGVFADRAGVWAIGFESIKSLDVCSEPPTAVTKAAVATPGQSGLDASTK